MKFIQLKAIFKGNVQGVFFRQHVKKYAEKYKVNGYVKNLLDGSVEMVAVSDKNTLDRLMDEILKKPGFGSVKTVKKKYFDNFEKFEDFQIIY